MSVLYRALWTDEQADVPAYMDQVRRLFSVWATTKEVEPLADGSSEVQLWNGRSRSINLRSLEHDGDQTSGTHGIEGITQEVGDGDSVWTTVVRAVSDENTVQVWVENRVETDDLTRRFEVGRPRLVDDLLSLPGKPYLGGSALTIDVTRIGASEIPVLVEILKSDRRSLPVIVCSEPHGEHDGRWLTRAEKIARRAGGIATVVALDSDAVTALRKELGDLAIWGGGVRTYTPTSVEPSRGWQHRFIRGHLMSGSESAMVDRIVYSVAQMSARRRVPETFRAFTSTAPAEQSGSTAGFVSEETAELERLHWEQLVADQVAATNEVERELMSKVGHLDRIRTALEAKGLLDLFFGTLSEDKEGAPDEVQDTSDAVMAAQMYLSDWITVPDEAPQELDGIDTAPNAYAWGNSTWRGFRALAAYAQAKSDGFASGFYEWCQSGAPMCWPATQKKLAMTESDSVQNNRKRADARRFPVSKDVEPSGEVTMWSHLKIAEGGGDLAPRVYFHDDTNGATKKVHVGFVGPHHLVPNTKS